MIPAVELGGSHIASALVDPDTWTTGPIRQWRIDPHGTKDALIDALVKAAEPVAGVPLCLAMPGPFDYPGGIALYEGVAKFDALRGTDVRKALYRALAVAPSHIGFVNDAVAFAAGEWVAGAGRGAGKLVGLTLGTGVGTAWLDRGTPVYDGLSVPPDARADLLLIDGRPLEDTVSTRAILRRYGRPAGGVQDVVDAARAGDREARDLLLTTYTLLGETLGPWIRKFRADLVVVGGGITSAWDVIGPPLMATLGPVEVRPAQRPAEAALLGCVHLCGCDTVGSP
jgi:glucokinase